MNAKKIYSITSRTASVVIVLLTIALYEAPAQGRVVLNGAKVTLANGATVVLDNPSSNAITRVSGHIISEGENNILQWNTGTTTGSYTVPWGFGNTDYIPLTFTKASGAGNGRFKFATYHTTWDNSSDLPTGVTNMNGIPGADVSAFAVDRFWQISAEGYTVKPVLTNVSFSYLSTEYDAPNNTSLESRLTAQRWNASASSWNDYTSGGIANASANTVTISSLDAANLYPWWALTYPGSNLHWVAPSNSVWNSASNWSTTPGGAGGAGVPTAADAVFFESNRVTNCTVDVNAIVYNMNVLPGYTGTISQGTNTMTIDNAATLGGGIFQGGASDITVNGQFTIAGTAFTAPSAALNLKNNFSLTSGSFAHNNGTLRLSGTNGQQAITSSRVNTFNNIVVTNTSATPAVSIESSQNLSGVLTLANNVVFDADGSQNSAILTLISTGDNPTKDAAIGVLPSGASVIGNVTVQRFMAIEGPSNGRIYRYVASPLQNAIVADVQKEIPVTGAFTGTSKCSGCGTAASMFAYNEKAITDTNKSGAADYDDGYENFPVASNSEILTPGKGYAMFVRGNQITSALWDVRGIINSGNVTPVTLPVYYTSSGKAANDGWNLVGNPYPSTIDWNAAKGWIKTNVDAAIYIRDNASVNTQVAAWNGVVGTNGGSSTIALGQGFWVKANGNGVPVLQADENVKAAGTQTTFFKKAAPTDLLRITLAKGTTRDETIVHFREDATENYDSHADALKLANATFNLSTLMSGGKEFAINSLAPFNCSSTVKLNIQGAAAGSYSLDFSGYESFPKGIEIMLTDNFTNNVIDVRKTTSYNFSVTAQAASTGANRFLVSFSQPTVQDKFSIATQNICSGSDAVVNISNSQTDVAYSAHSKNSNILSSSVLGNGNEIQVRIPAGTLLAGVDTILVTAAGNNCSQPVIKSIALNIEKKAEIVSVENSKQCEQGAVTLQATGAPEKGSYRWYTAEAGTTPIPDQQSSTFTTPSLSASQVYYVSAVSALGCEGSRKPVLAEIVKLSASITERGDSLISNYTNGNQWYLNQTLLPGANTQSIKAEKSGVYQVEVSLHGCTTTATRELTVTGTEQTTSSIAIYPNPVARELHIEIPASFSSLTTFKILNMVGQPIGIFDLHQDNNMRTGTFDMKNYPSGVYIVQGSNASSVVEFKIVKE
jgi:hypothetical protein